MKRDARQTNTQEANVQSICDGPDTSRVSPSEAMSKPITAGRATTAEYHATLVHVSLSDSCCDVP